MRIVEQLLGASNGFPLTQSMHYKRINLKSTCSRFRRQLLRWLFINSGEGQ
jgi:hypothetical protein